MVIAGLASLGYTVTMMPPIGSLVVVTEAGNSSVAGYVGHVGRLMAYYPDCWANFHVEGGDGATANRALDGPYRGTLGYRVRGVQPATPEEVAAVQLVTQGAEHL
jgi:hypothetical protein